MKRKGLTPVIAVVLLISVTVAAAGVVAQYLDLIGEVTQDTDADQIVTDLHISMESCWEVEEGEEYHAQFRQTHSNDAVEVSEHVILISGGEPDVSYSYDGQDGLEEDVVVNPGDTFTLEISEGDEVSSEDLETPFSFEVISGSDDEAYTCNPR